GVRLRRRGGARPRDADHLVRPVADDQSPAGLGAPAARRGGSLMAAARSTAVLDEIASRPGRVPLRAALARWAFIGVSLAFLGALLLAPLCSVIFMALEKGWTAYVESFTDADTGAEIRLTLLTALIVVPINTL